MLGVRLDPETEAALERHAKAVGRSKSALVRDWVREALTRDARQARLRQAAADWQRISRAERDDPEMNEILEFAEANAAALDEEG